MCRMILSIGRFNVGKLIEAATTMSYGNNYEHEYSGKLNNGEALVKHNDGWGMVYLKENGKFFSYHCKLSIQKDPKVNQFRKINSNCIIIHVRNASIKSKKGIAFTHPIEKHIPRLNIFFFHNGYAPNIFKLLNKPNSKWDSLDLFEWLIHNINIDHIKSSLACKLKKLPSSTTAANFILVWNKKVIICNWFPKNTRTPEYYTMHGFVNKKFNSNLIRASRIT